MLLTYITVTVLENDNCRSKVRVHLPDPITLKDLTEAFDLIRERYPDRIRCWLMIYSPTLLFERFKINQFKIETFNTDLSQRRISRGLSLSMDNPQEIFDWLYDITPEFSPEELAEIERIKLIQAKYLDS